MQIPPHFFTTQTFSLGVFNGLHQLRQADHIPPADSVLLLQVKQREGIQRWQRGPELLLWMTEGTIAKQAALNISNAPLKPEPGRMQEPAVSSKQPLRLVSNSSYPAVFHRSTEVSGNTTVS